LKIGERPAGNGGPPSSMMRTVGKSRRKLAAARSQAAKYEDRWRPVEQPPAPVVVRRADPAELAELRARAARHRPPSARRTNGGT
jgi:hypothetical protein